MKKSYAKLLKEAPAHDLPEFIDYLRANNPVVFEDDDYIVIENAKYHTKKKPWLTAFHKGKTKWASFDLDYLISVQNPEWQSWNWLKKSRDKQTVPGRFHVHIYK